MLVLFLLRITSRGHSKTELKVEERNGQRSSLCGTPHSMHGRPGSACVLAGLELGVTILLHLASLISLTMLQPTKSKWDLLYGISHPLAQEQYLGWGLLPEIDGRGRTLRSEGERWGQGNVGLRTWSLEKLSLSLVLRGSLRV